MLLAKSVTGEEVARQIIMVVSTELSVPPGKVLAAMRDRASVNNVAIRTISVIYDQVIDVGCFSHTLDNVGNRMKIPTLINFTTIWISLFSHSPKARLARRMRTGMPYPSYSPTRSFGDILQECDLPLPTVNKLLEVLKDQGRMRELNIEIAITVDALESFVKCTYDLEGDGPLALVA